MKHSCLYRGLKGVERERTCLALNAERCAAELTGTRGVGRRNPGRRGRRRVAAVIAATVAGLGGAHVALAGLAADATVYDDIPSGGVLRECVHLYLGDNTGAPGYGINPRGALVTAYYGNTCANPLPRFGNWLYAQAEFIYSGSGAHCGLREDYNDYGSNYAQTASVPTAGCPQAGDRRLHGEGAYNHSGAGYPQVPVEVPLPFNS